jgi:uncharacterized membrane protein
LVLLGLEAIVGAWLRFSAPSLLWLDEALTVNIAKVPLSQLHAALKEDGAPPLYYLLLHFWMLAFGTSDAAVRSLSGVLSCATVIVVFTVVRRVWGNEVALFAAALLIGSSFATYYATETRMYALVMLLCALGAWALVALFERPSISRMVPLALVLVALEYTHYWSFYLFITLGVWLLALAARAKATGTRRAGRLGIGALVVAGICFLPWWPTFSFQQKHTGTPWGRPPNFETAIVAVFHYNSDQAVQVAWSSLIQRGVEVLMIVLIFLALFVVAIGPWRISLRVLTMPRARLVAWLALGTLVLGVVASHFSNAAFVPRYASVAYLPLIVLLALGTRGIWQPALRVLVILAVVAGTLVVGFQQRNTQRSQAGQIVASLTARATAGSVVLFCPDQLGPSVMRILPDEGLKAYGYPRFDDPNFVNWVDYDKALEAISSREGLQKVLSLADGHSIWLVSSSGYAQAGDICAALKATMDAALPHHQWVAGEPTHYFQSMVLTQYTPGRSTPSAAGG